MKMTRLVVGLALSLALVPLLSGCQKPSQTASIEHPKATHSASGHYEQDTEKFHVEVDAVHPPFMTGESEAIVHVEDAFEQPAEAVSGFELVMPMEGGTPMEAPLTVEKLPEPGSYQLSIMFTMPGQWLLKVKPTSSAENVTVPLLVKEK